ncbi:MAG: hypothetical protein ACLR07_16965 [Christensenellales bacterium]
MRGGSAGDFCDFRLGKATLRKAKRAALHQGRFRNTYKLSVTGKGRFIASSALRFGMRRIFWPKESTQSVKQLEKAGFLRLFLSFQGLWPRRDVKSFER